MNTRRQFLITAPLGVLGVAVACRGEQQQSATFSTPPTTPGAPPTFAEAEKLAQVTMSATEREMAAANWRQSMAPLLERRVGPRKIPLEPHIAPATRWNPVLAGETSGPTRDTFVRSMSEAVPLPTSDADIAFSHV